MTEGYGIRLILGLVEDDRYLALEGTGQIIRDKAHVISKGAFSAWRVLYVKRGSEWILYDGFDIDKIIENEDGKGVEPYEEDCDDDCDERDCVGEDCFEDTFGSKWNINHNDKDIMIYYADMKLFATTTKKNVECDEIYLRDVRGVYDFMEELLKGIIYNE